MHSEKKELLNDRVWKIIDECRDCVFITQTAEGFPRARTMSKLQDRDRSGGFMWFVSEKNSKKVREIAANPKVTLFFSHPQSFDYACVFGTAGVTEDPEVKQRFWEDEWLKYFKEGPKDGNYVIVKVVPEKGEFFFNNDVRSGIISYTPKNIF